MMIMLAGCGGEPAPETPQETAAPVEAPVATEQAAPAGSGTRHEVQMVLEGTNYLFKPAELTIRPGDQVVFRGVSGSFHNVQFWADSVAANAKAALDAVIPNRMGELATNLINEGDSLVFNFTGVPAGRYPFTCLPHMAMGMHGVLTISQ
ncbi:MAG TPA: plastocyanin/azurin family copper-binding protein [Gemmatimonadales bacterium]|nr:plastocyanin/azurin family copper-binding protein [Gemmatimonadales bacterium]